MKLPDFLTPAEAQAIHAALPTLSVKEKMELFDLLEEKERRSRLQAAQNSVVGFAHAVYPGFKEGAHHRALSKIFDDIVNGRKHRVVAADFHIAHRVARMLGKLARGGLANLPP